MDEPKILFDNNLETHLNYLINFPIYLFFINNAKTKRWNTLRNQIWNIYYRHQGVHKVSTFISLV